MGLSRCPGVCVSGWSHLRLSEFPPEQQEEAPGNASISHSCAWTMLSSAPTEPCGEGLCPGKLQPGKLLHHSLSVEGLLVSGAALPPAPEGL